MIGAGAHTSPAAATFQTALVNVIQNNHNRIGTDQTWAVCNYQPTEMCLGMAHVLGVHVIWKMFGNQAGLVRMKGGLSQEAFGSKGPKLLKQCNLKDFAWKPFGPEALAQLEDATLFDQTARSMLAAMTEAVKTADSTRAQESADIAAALRTLPQSEPPGAGAFPEADTVYTHMVFGMVGQTWNPTMQGVRDRLSEGEALMGNNIAGILLDDKFNIVAWALNFSGENPTFHAETLMIQRFLRDKGLTKLPKNYTLYTSLQPCDMCAGFLMHVGDDLKVVYCLPDMNLRTALSNSRVGTTERQVNVAQATTISQQLVAKQRTDGGASSTLLRDGDDLQYRANRKEYLFTELWLRKNLLSAQDQTKLSALQQKKDRRQWLSDEDFNWMLDAERYLKKISRQVDQKQELAQTSLAGMQQHSPLHSTGGLANVQLMNDGKVAEAAKNRFGFEFVKSCDLIVNWCTTGATEKVKKACAQGVEVFEAIVTGGLSTAYGLGMINFVIQKQAAREALAAAAKGGSA